MARIEILAANDARSPVNKFNIPATCGKCHGEVQSVYRRAFTARRSCAETGRRRSAPIAMASTPSRRPPIPVHRPPIRACRVPVAPTATRVCGSRRSSTCPETASPPTWTAITGSPRRVVPWWWPTAPVATACIIFCPPAIRAPPSIQPIWTLPAVSATRESRRTSPATRCMWMWRAGGPRTRAQSRCDGSGGSTFP